MPKIGELRIQKESGRVRHTVWLACPDCGKERWVYLCKGKPTSTRCLPCKGKFQRKVTMETLSLGDIKKGYELGKGSSYTYTNFGKRICSMCGDMSWVRLIRGEMKYELCRRCSYKAQSGKNSKLWKGRKVTTEGYVMVYMDKADFFHSMANINSYALEHRLVMARHLGRCLQHWEIVHHKGTKYPKSSRENKADNRIENLQLVTDDRHKQITILENRIKYLERQLEKQQNLIAQSQARITILEAEKVLEESQ